MLAETAIGLVFDYARQCYKRDIEELLDDPSWVSEYPQHFADMRELGKVLRLDFDKVVSKLGSEFERERLKEIEANLKEGKTNG